MKLYVDAFCELAGVLQSHTTEKFYDLTQLPRSADACYVVGRVQLRDRLGLVRELIAMGARVVFSNPAEGSETFVHHLQHYGAMDLAKAGMPLIVGGAVPQEFNAMRYEHFLSQPFRFEENQQAAQRSNEIFDKKAKPYSFLFLNGRSRPQRTYLINALAQRGLLDSALWTNLDTHSGAVKLLPQQYEVDQFHAHMNPNSTGFVKYELFNNLWGEIYIKPEAYIDTYFSLVSETVIDYPHSFVTEKTAKPLVMAHPFVVAATPGFYRHLHNLGFRTFSHVIDESFDQIDNTHDRLNRIAAVVDDLVRQDMLQLLEQCAENCKYNQQHLRELTLRLPIDAAERFLQFIK